VLAPVLDALGAVAESSSRREPSSSSNSDLIKQKHGPQRRQLEMRTKPNGTTKAGSVAPKRIRSLMNRLAAGG